LSRQSRETFFAETNLCIVRLDKLSRNEDNLGKLRVTYWDLIVCDEAHKMVSVKLSPPNVMAESGLWA